MIADSSLAPLIGQKGPNVIPGRYIVRFKPDGADPAALANEAFRGLSQASVLAVYKSVKGFHANLPDQALDAVRRNPHVAAVEYDMVLHLQGDQTTSSNANLWGLDRIDQATGQDGNFHYDANGSGVHIYVLDSGVDSTQHEFSGRIGAGHNKTGDPYVPCFAHGTYVASVAAGSIHGVAKGATVHSVRVSDCSGNVSSGDAAEGVDWIIANVQRPAVINISITGPLNCVLFICGNQFDDEIRAAINAGIVVVIAAGNDNSNACNYAPSRVAQAITVAATDQSDNRSVWIGGSASNWGSCVDIFAPGTGIGTAEIYTYDAETVHSGTSLAAPFVTGAVASYLQDSPSATPAQVWDQVSHAATHGVIQNAGSGSPNAILNSNIPGQPIANIEGPTIAGAMSCSWTAMFVYGRGPFTYQWSGILSGNQMSIDGVISVPGELNLIVTDVKGRSSQASIWVAVDSQARACT